MTRVPMTSNAPRPSIKCALLDKAKSAADWLRAAVTDPNPLIVMAFCAIGLFVALLAAFLGEPA